MVNQSYCSPKLTINGVSYNTLKELNLNFPGNNQINKLSFTLATSEIREQALYGKPLELFLNYGSEDGLPIFRGIIKEITPSDTQTSFTALDARSLLSGNNTTPLNITDKHNYDGYTLGQFLQKIIQEDYMNLEYNHNLASDGSEITSNLIATGDGVRADATDGGSDALFEETSNSGAAQQFIYGQYVELNDGFSTKRFEFTNDTEAEPVAVGSIAVLISSTAGEQGIKNSVENLMTAIESNLHISCDWSGSGSTSAVPFVVKVDGSQRVAGAQGNTTTSQGYEAGKTANWNPFRAWDGSRVNDGHKNFSGGSGSSTYSGTITTDLPVRKKTLTVEVNNMTAGEGAYVVKGSDTGYSTLGDGSAVTTSPHVSTDISPKTTIESGSIDYELGTVSMTFSNPVWSGEKIRFKYYRPSKENAISLLGTELLNDTNPAVSLTGYRNNKISPYQVILDKLNEAVDTTDIEKPKEWFVQVREDDKRSNIVFVKRKSKDSATSSVLSYRDGISSLKYQQRLPANTGLAAGKEGGRQVFAYGNRPKGIVSKDIKITKQYPAEAHKEAIVEIFKELEEVNDVSISANKLPYIELESIIDLNVEDDEVTGKAVVVGKSIRWSRSSMSIDFKLDRRPVRLSDFIQ
tara:strand:+ start:2722 stop:4623 length:1902 start_codon:yes stop_codon:yes gene_type:complete